MANSYTIFVGLILVAALCLVAYILAPKGENQTVWRSSIILALSAMYIMWALTILAQLHPLVAPRRNDLRPEKHMEGPGSIKMFS
ncbi:putative vacuolar ATP synthase subunit E [Terfezia boudieri ATCC MYA-4762]|uniref:Putative vacuolar ATP synthase subunit E n=1 Tax=Terfezia boudieri ATCC MYA-4762 TaxID=1051890 RepID=A0A3N4LN96_9PEZI|nr:putative vacuolar ATP synthase subunit E [Terfezia boudieri ATCC MYA-4762]